MPKYLNAEFCEQYNVIIGKAMALGAILVDPVNPTAKVEELVKMAEAQYTLTGEFATVEEARKIMAKALSVVVQELEKATNAE